MENFEYKDMFGREIQVGDYIAYAGTAGRSAVMRAGQVIELTQTKTSYGKKEPKIRVKSWDNFRSRGWREDEEYSGRQKDVTLGFLDRMIVIDPASVSEKVKADLNGPVCDWNGKPLTKEEE